MPAETAIETAAEAPPDDGRAFDSGGYRRILVVLDRGDAVQAHPEGVRGLALNAETEVILLRVVDSAYDVIAKQMPPAGPIDPPVERVMEAQRLAAERTVRDAAGELRRAGVRHVTPLVVAGIPGNAIVEVARERGCDAIVMASGPSAGLRRRPFSSTAEFVLREAESATVHLVRVAEEASPGARRGRLLQALTPLLRAPVSLLRVAARLLPQPPHARSTS